MRGVRGALVFAFALGLALASSRAARACSCLPPAPPLDAASRAAAVFEGRTFGARREQNELRFSFEVTRVWKGEVPASIDVVTPLSSAACGRSFEFGVPYVVYATPRDDGSLADNMCSRTRMVVDAVEDLDVLGAGRPPASHGTSAPGPEGSDVEPPRIEPKDGGAPPVVPGKRGCAVDPEPPPSRVLLLLALLLVGRPRLWQRIGHELGRLPRSRSRQRARS
jgi:MYXO-CTERM domain-containing protein